MPSVLIQGKPLKLAAPRGFVNIQAVAPSIFEEYRRAQHAGAVYRLLPYEGKLSSSC